MYVSVIDKQAQAGISISHVHIVFKTHMVNSALEWGWGANQAPLQAEATLAYLFLRAFAFEALVLFWTIQQPAS
jgi:hypothetical protein